jgi:hypothetical protein
MGIANLMKKAKSERETQDLDKDTGNAANSNAEK